MTFVYNNSNYYVIRRFVDGASIVDNASFINQSATFVLPLFQLIVGTSCSLSLMEWDICPLRVKQPRSGLSDNAWYLSVKTEHLSVKTWHRAADQRLPVKEWPGRQIGTTAPVYPTHRVA